MMPTQRSPRWLPAAVAASLAAISCGGGGGPTSPPPGPPPPPPPVGASLDLQAGEVRVLSDAASIRAFELVGAAAAREYEVIVMSASRTEGAFTPLRLAASVGGASAATVPRREAVRPRVSAYGTTRGTRSAGAGERLRSAGDAELARLGARPARPTGPDGRLALSTAAVVPSVGEPVTIRSAIVPGGGLDCFTNTPIAGTVRAVGQNFAIVEDDAAAGFLDGADFAELDRELDDFIAPVDQDYFGQPADLDGNGRTIAFFTRQVNRLTPPGAAGIVIGFFTNVDLADRQDCPSSNEAEIIWLIAPDPDGEVGPQISVDFVKSIARGLVAHEFQHLLNAQRRVTLGSGTFNDTEDVWLNEGLSHIGEEVSGLFRLALPTRANLGFTEIGVGAVERAAFEDFHEGNLQNIGSYLESPSTAPALATSAPGGTSNFAMRGFGYMFLRWLGDRYGPTGQGVVQGSAERDLFRELTTGGPTHLTGIDNILRAIDAVSGTAPTWDDVLAEYFAAPAADDAAAAGLSQNVQFQTWNYPRVWEELRSSGIPGLTGGDPLSTTPVAMGPGASLSSSFDLAASAARYFSFRAAGAHPDMLVEVTGPSGANIGSSARARVIVVRSR